MFRSTLHSSRSTLFFTRDDYEHRLKMICPISH
jgi:hypothetical protein